MNYSKTTKMENNQLANLKKHPIIITKVTPHAEDEIIGVSMEVHEPIRLPLNGLPRLSDKDLLHWFQINCH